MYVEKDEEESQDENRKRPHGLSKVTIDNIKKKF